MDRPLAAPNNSYSTILIGILSAAILTLAPHAAFAANNADDYLHTGPDSIGLGMRRGHKSQAQLDDAVKHNPKSVTAYLERGDGYLGSSDNEKALADFNKALKLDVNCGKAYIGRYLVFCGMGQTAKALAELKNAQRVGPPDLAMDAVNLNAELYVETNKLPEALVEYTRVINSNLFSKARLAQVYLRRGILYDRLQKMPAAISDFTSAIKLNSNLGPAYLYRANDYRRQGKLKDAIADYNFVASRTENIPEAKRNLDMEIAREELYRYRSDYFKSIYRPDLADADLKKLKQLQLEEIEASPFQLR